MSQYTILLVDYDPRSIERTTQPLEAAGFKVEVSKDGLAAMTAFETLKPDLVLLEAMIPKKHGFEVCGELKKTPAGQDTPIIIITAVYKGRKYRMQAMHLHGADAYVERPVPDEELISICREHVRGGESPSAPAPAPSKATSKATSKTAKPPAATPKAEPAEAAPASPAKPAAASAGGDESHSDEEEEILAHLDAILSAEASGEDRDDDEVPGAATG
jgi:DNA-binding response OmpR family regulator